ncbi:hypothetical protein BLX24_23910 [Arsenicibacter rosenii]|uniref:Uncharacterized protein n=1 Tax=Arsenicibacter rosenii TaxID=1750698 RepID=A0A1S2VEG8_9BACT|nr:hypothetical protein BLX24_23910 [Arsenicibacter rosenii]
MDGQFNKQSEVICCFCGKGLLVKDAVILNVQPNIESEEIQNFFSHKKHFTELIDKSIPLHPDFFEDDDDIEM